MKLQEQKMAMSEAIINTENSSMYSMGTDRLLDLFTFQTADDEDDRSVDAGLKALGEVDEEWFDEEYSSLSVEEFVEAFKR